MLSSSPDNFTGPLGCYSLNFFKGRCDEVWWDLECVGHQGFGLGIETPPNPKEEGWEESDIWPPLVSECLLELLVLLTLLEEVLIIPEVPTKTDLKNVNNTFFLEVFPCQFARVEILFDLLKGGVMG